MIRGAISGALWLLPAKAIQAAAHFAGIFVLARYFLDPREFGLAVLVLAVTGLLSAGADLGMGLLNVQRRSIDDRTAARWAGLGGLASFAFAALAAPAIARLLGAPEGFVPLLQAGALALLLAGIVASARARIARALDFRTLAFADVCVALMSAGTRIGFAAGGYGAWSIVLGDLFAAITGATIVWLSAPRMQPGEPGPLIGDGLRIVATRAADAGTAQADRFSIGRFLGAGPLGHYAFAWQHAMVLIQQLTPVAEQIALPIFSRLQTNRPALVRAYLGLTKVFALIVIPFSGVVFLATPALVEWLYPERWQDSIPVMRALCVTAAAAGLNSHPGLVWIAMGDIKLRARWSLINLIAIVAVIAAGLPFGAVGIAYALAARSLIATIVAQVITKRRAGVGHADYVRALLPGALIGGGFFLLALLQRR